MKDRGAKRRSGDHMSGTLYFCATPIGNLQDVTLRLLDTLRAVDLIAAEDTRHTRKLLTHFDIHRPLTSLHEHNEQQKADEIVAKVLAGQSVAVVSDAGMPGISDPGAKLVQVAAISGVPMTVIPGPSAALTGLVISGLDTSRFVFLGFPPRGKAERQDWLRSLESLPFTLIFYEAPHRLRQFLNGLNLLWPERIAAVARELTKQYEEVKRGTVGELAAFFQENEPRGEFVVLVSGSTGSSQMDDQQSLDLTGGVAEVHRLVEQGEEASVAIKSVAKQHGLSRRELYNLYHR